MTGDDDDDDDDDDDEQESYTELPSGSLSRLNDLSSPNGFTRSFTCSHMRGRRSSRGMMMMMMTGKGEG
jgi:hypothetical protein